MKTAFLFGGSGFIGQHLINRFLELEIFDAYVIYDLVYPNFLADLPDKVTFQDCDVRKEIPDFNRQVDPSSSWIFNLAAVHREPGHQPEEYFETNIQGARHISDFAHRIGVQNLFFTSSIAPYGKSLDERTEKSLLHPETPYGISKKEAESIHQHWNTFNHSSRLIIVRPSVIYGSRDRGNIFRMIRALKKGTFVLPNRGNVVKSYGYVHGLVDSVLFTMNKTDKEIIYNYTEYPVLNLRQMTQAIKKELNYKKPVFGISVKWLTVIAFCIQNVSKILGLKSDIHPVRVRKAAFPTNIKPQYLIDQGFEFRFGLVNSLKHWKSIAPDDFV